MLRDTTRIAEARSLFMHTKTLLWTKFFVGEKKEEEPVNKDSKGYKKKNWENALNKESSAKTPPQSRR